MDVSQLREWAILELNSDFEQRELNGILKILFKDIFKEDYIQLKNLNKDIQSVDIKLFKSCIIRLKQKEPLQYILGHTLFFGLKINCNASALIPRPETEELVDWILQLMPERTLNVLDIGTGTGCIPIALKSQRPFWQINGVDVDASALKLAEINAELNQQSVDFFLDDILSTKLNKKWDVIVSNPPYIPISESLKMAENVLKFEPHLALFTPDDDPLLFYKCIVTFASKSLNNEGWLFFEIHEDMGREVKALLSAADFINIELRKDLQGKERMICGQKLIL